MKRTFVKCVFLLPSLAAADFYQFPPTVEFDPVCKPVAEEVEAVEKLYSDPDAGAEGVARAIPVDLNGDGQCEIFLDHARLEDGNGNEWVTVLIKRGNEFVSAGDIQWLPDTWWYGEFRNGYPRIFVPTYTGHRTNPEYVTAVYSFDGKEYVRESGVTATHGHYLDQGLNAYRAGDYALSEKYYLNAYRMQRIPGMADANNLALTWLKLGMMKAAKALLEKHLVIVTSPHEEAAAHFNLGLIDERLGLRADALLHYECAVRLAPTPARLRKVEELKDAPAANAQRAGTR